MEHVLAMTADLTHRPSPGRALRLLRHAWTTHWRRRAEHATVAILRSLDNRALKDIGIDRSEIESVVCGPRDRRIRVSGCFQQP